LANPELELLELSNKVCDLGFALAYWVFWRRVQIVESGFVSAGLPCYRVQVVGRCRVTRQLVAGYGIQNFVPDGDAKFGAFQQG
jgi:hypothetical protein